MDYWQKQTDQPLFPDLLWSRPQNRQTAGKLVIIGGNSHGFAAPVTAFGEAEKAGFGTGRVLLPDATQKMLGKHLENVFFLPSSPSGSFGQKALAELLEQSAWSDGALLAGDFGRNSETAVLLESFISKYNGLLILAKDSIDNFYAQPKTILNRPQTALACTTGQLQKLLIQAGSMQPVYLGMNLVQLVEVLHEITKAFEAHIIVKHHQNVLVACQGQVSSTSTDLTEDDPWRVPAGAWASVFWLQNPSQPYAALTSAVYHLGKGKILG